MNHVDPLQGCRPVKADELGRLAPRPGAAPASVLAYDVYRTADELVIEFDVPGVDPSAVEVSVEGGALVVSVRRALPRGPGVDIVDTRRAHGVFTERLLLPSRWDHRRLRARVEDGVLSVRAPVTDHPRRHIPVDLGASAGGDPEQGAVIETPSERVTAHAAA